MGTARSFTGETTPARIATRLKPALAALALIACLTNASAQDVVTGSFESAVVNSKTGRPIPGAYVEIINLHSNLRLVRRTDGKGFFSSGAMPPGIYRLIISAPGFEPREIVQRLFVLKVNNVVPFPPTLDPATEEAACDTGELAVAALPNSQVEVVSAETGARHAGNVPADESLYVFGKLAPGEYRVTVTRVGYQAARAPVVVMAGRARPLTMSLQPTESTELIASRAGRFYALVIGNNSYQHIESLKTARNDAEEISRLLKSRYGFETNLLLDASREQILSALSDYRRTLDADSNLLIYYAGHGTRDEEVGRAYWLPVEAKRDNDSSWISADDITARVRGIKAKHVLIISDSCYSGTLSRGVGEALARPSERDKALLRMVGGKSRRLMASGGNEPVADEGGGDHSVFASALLRGFREMDRDIFSADELFLTFIKQAVAGNAKQTPDYSPLRDSGHDSGDFVFVRRK
jgi:hypothetical protein